MVGRHDDFDWSESLKTVRIPVEKDSEEMAVIKVKLKK